MGFLANGTDRTDKTANTYTTLEQVTPEDLLQFGFIPELVGRLPIVSPLQSLDRESLVRVLIEPKNAIVRQYQQLFAIDDVKLEFTDDALVAAAERALTYHTGARILRHIVEDALLEVMYELPSLADIGRCVVNGEAIMGESSPRLDRRSGGRYLTLKSALAKASRSVDKKTA